MATKTQLEQRFAECNQALETTRAELKQLQRILRSTRLAVQVTKDDLGRNLEPFTLCEEAASEMAERYERGLQVARERLATICDALELGQEVSIVDSLWRSTPTENELFSAYLEEPAPGSEGTGEDNRATD